MLLKGDWARRRRSSELAKKFASSKFEGDLPYWMGVLEGIIAPFAWHGAAEALAGQEPHEMGKPNT